MSMCPNKSDFKYRNQKEVTCKIIKSNIRDLKIIKHNKNDMKNNRIQ